MTFARVRLALALAAFLGWMGYLAYAAATKDRGPIVSHSLVAVAEAAAVADVAAGPDGRPLPRAKGNVVGGAAADFEADVVDLPEAEGFAGPGKYLLLLERAGRHYRLVRLPRSPGYERPAADRKPAIYPWTADVQAQFARLKK